MTERSDNRRIRDLHGIGAARQSHGLVEELLNIVIASHDAEIADGSIGLVDQNHSRLRLALDKLMLVDANDVRAAISQEAGDALDAFRHSLRPVHEAYGVTAGPDRTAGQARAANTVMVEAASGAKEPFMRYWAEVGGIELPPIEAYLATLRSDSADRRANPVPAPVRPVTTVPKVRLPREGFDTAMSARVLAGNAFGTAALAHARFVAGTARKAPHANTMALGDFSSLLGASSMGSSILRRSAAVPADRHIGEEASAVYDDVQAVVDVFEGEFEGDGSVPDAQALQAATFACVRSLATRVRRIDRLAALAGYDLAPEETAETSPAP